MVQRKLCEAEAEIEARNWEKRNSGVAFQEIKQEFESQRCQLHQASRKADQVQGDKISLCGELELRNSRLFQENHARDCQEIEELSLQHEESHNRELDDGSDSGFTERSKFLVRCKIIITT